MGSVIRRPNSIRTKMGWWRIIFKGDERKRKK